MWPWRTLRLGRPSPWICVEDPDDLGYTLVRDPLLDVMDAEEWRALERSAVRAAARDLR